MTTVYTWSVSVSLKVRQKDESVITLHFHLFQHLNIKEYTQIPLGLKGYNKPPLPGFEGLQQTPLEAKVVLKQAY